MLGKIDGHWQITTRSSSVLLNIDIETFLYEERYAEIQLYSSSEEDERNGVQHAVLTFQREWDDKAGLHWYLTLLTFTDANGWWVYIEACLLYTSEWTSLSCPFRVFILFSYLL